MRDSIMKKFANILLLLVIVVSMVVAQEKVDTAAISRIKSEGMNNSQVMELLSYLSDVYGPRLTGSPGFLRAANWARGKLASMGMENAHLEAWGPFGRAWNLKHYSANVIGGQVFPLISYPKAWSPSTGGSITRDLIYFDAKTDSAVVTYAGKLKGKFVLLNDPREIKAHFEPEASREADSSLLNLANAEPADPRRRRPEMKPDQKA